MAKPGKALRSCEVGGNGQQFNPALLRFLPVRTRIFHDQPVSGAATLFRRSAKVILEQPPQLTAADSKPLGQAFDIGVAAIKRAIGDLFAPVF